MDAEESRVVEETLGANADTENGLCQFITIPITDSLDQKNTFLLLSSQTMTQLQCCAKATGTINVLSYQHRLMLEFSLQAEDSKGEEVRVGQGAESYCLPETDWCATTRSLLLFPTHCCCYCLQTAAARIGNHI